MSVFSCILVGDETLLVGCGDQLLDRGADVRAVATGDDAVCDWAKSKNIPVVSKMSDLEGQFVPGSVDWLLSIANLRVIPVATLAIAARGAVNFHDGPLPEYAGLNTPVWALIDGQHQHGITWHHIDAGIDEGPILVERRFDVSDDATAHSLNSQCYAAAMDSFPEVMDELASQQPNRQVQDLTKRRYFGMSDRPDAVALLDFKKSSAEVVNLVRALSFGSYWNPVAVAKVEIAGKVFAVGRARTIDGNETPGTVLEVSGDSIVLAVSDGAVQLSELREMNGQIANLEAVVSVDDTLKLLDDHHVDELNAIARDFARHEGHWRGALGKMQPVEVSLSNTSMRAENWTGVDIRADHALTLDCRIAVVGLWAISSAGMSYGSVAFSDTGLVARSGDKANYVNTWVPLTIDRAGATSFADVRGQIAQSAANLLKHKGFMRDLMLRDPRIDAGTMPSVGISMCDAPICGTDISVSVVGTNITVHVDQSRISVSATKVLTDRLSEMMDLAARDPDLGEFDGPTVAEQESITAWNQTDVEYDQTLTLHGAFEAQVRKSPDQVALVFQDQELTYGALNARANAVAATLRAAGVGPGTNVGFCVRRSMDLLIGSLGILKAGGAYVPLDPEYPSERIAHCLTDSAAPVVLTQSDVQGVIPATGANVILMDAIDGEDRENIDGGATASDLAYLIYTSGSTGKPKGVMVEHRNVANFFAGMDQHIDHEQGGVWLAVTSLAFDISVLELFYTLARGFKVVVTGDDNRAVVSGDTIAVSDQPMDFGLYYWGNDGGAGAKKYELLLEGAKFADQNGFTSIWTPERHFHAFGGPYPNPSVTGAAVAAVTNNLSVRAGSCVAPLHHPARIAEEWAVIDNLTNGKAGIGFASGWQPDDFVLRPENTPPKNKPALYETLKTVRKLWRGETVGFPTESGDTHDVVTQPRPVSAELPVWVTTAGNPDTWREAGELGANILTHLLGQTIEEVSGKIDIYHKALRTAGHDPADFKVTMMLHTYLADDRDTARQIAREPMKDYLRSAAGLIKQYAWAFPAFKRPEGVKNPFEMDLGGLTSEELEAILDFAFERYFEDAGLFGTVADGVARSEQLKAIGVSEIACLIDYGIDVETVMQGLVPLAEVLRQSNAPVELANDDFSVAAQIVRHRVTHMQCTPSMARLISMNSEARMALGRVKHLLLGGEACPSDLVDDLRGATRANLFNMYGPTETTIWSTVQPLSETSGKAISIGRPIANTTVHVLGENKQPVPIGVRGELWIGGAGVTRGYWQRDAMTNERYQTLKEMDQTRLYRTGDLVAMQPNGSLAFFGRADHQVKIRGQRIELGEIESCLKEFAGVTEAIVVTRETRGDTRLAAYFTSSAVVPEAVLRTHLKKHLPDAMVPSTLTSLDAFPLTPNKKIDRNALPEPSLQAAPVIANETQAPTSDVGRTIATVWSDILGVNNPSAGDNFFDLGGHSLLAVQAHRDIRARLEGISLSITDIFRFPILGDLTAHLEKSDHKARPEIKPAMDEKARSATMSKRRAMRAGRGVKS